MAIYVYGSGGGGANTDVSDTTAIATDVLPTKYFYLADGTRAEGTISTKAAATIIPSTSDQTIASGQYLSGTQTIQAITRATNHKYYSANVDASSNTLTKTFTVAANILPAFIGLYLTDSSLTTNKTIIQGVGSSTGYVVQNGTSIGGNYYSSTTGIMYNSSIAQITSYSYSGTSLSVTISPISASYIFNGTDTYRVYIIALG